MDHELIFVILGAALSLLGQVGSYFAMSGDWKRLFTKKEKTRPHDMSIVADVINAAWGRNTPRLFNTEKEI